MVVFAAAMYGGGGFAPAHGWTLVAAVMFYASDICVARSRFVSDDFINQLIGLPLYYVAQLIIAANIS